MNTPTYYDLQANIIDGDQLKASGKTVNMENLGEIIPGWGKSTAFEEYWIKALKEKNGKK